MAFTIKAVGLDEVVKKLDPENLLGEPVKRTIFREAAEAGRDYLTPLVPRNTGASAQTQQLTVRDAGYKLEDAGARLSVTADPLRYLEFGTKQGATKTLIRARGRYGVRTSGGSQRIKRRRFMAKTIGRTRREIRTRVDKAVKEIEANWSK